MAALNSEQPDGLESKWWYRLLRVILVSLYGLVLFWVLLVIYDGEHPHNVTDRQASVIMCDNGNAYPLAAIPGASISEHGNQLDEYHADSARSLCSYGQATAPTEGLENVEMPDGTLILGVPIVPSIDPGTGERVMKKQYVVNGKLGPNLMSYYQRWLDSSPANQTRPQTFRNGHPILRFEELTNYTAKEQFFTEGSWAKLLGYMAIAWLTIHLVFIFVRGAVLYVAVGKFVPVRGLRGWCTFHNSVQSGEHQ